MDQCIAYTLIHCIPFIIGDSEGAESEGTDIADGDGVVDGAEADLERDVAFVTALGGEGKGYLYGIGACI